MFIRSYSTVTVIYRKTLRSLWGKDVDVQGKAYLLYREFGNPFQNYDYFRGITTGATGKTRKAIRFIDTLALL